jgi:hypothetical protein
LRVAIKALIILLGCNVSAPADGPTTQPARTGQFEITFDQRSPQSEYSKILERLGTTKDEAGPDYELKDQPFIVYVPPDYDGSKPFGLMVWSFQDGCSGIYDSAIPLLNSHHLIVIATEKSHPQLAANTGLCLDAVYNMEQRYAIDASRVYLIGLSKPIMPIGMCTGDVFMGDVYCWWFEFYGPINGEKPVSPVKYKPAPGLARLAKLHMQVLEFNPTQALDLKNVPATLRQDGFEHVFGATMDDKSYFQPEWFEQVIRQLESVHASSTKSPDAVSSTQPSPDEPQRLLGLAQAFINSGRPDLAKRKLDLLISKYPDSPAAEQARQLLSQMNGQ